VLDVEVPEAGFYLWAAVPGGDDLAFARALLARQNVTILPGRLLAREAGGLNPVNPANAGSPGNPGVGHIRLALVAPLDECVQAARRIVEFAAST
jgi:N-succinyldiaminopimelate aminotransferase